MANLTFLWAVRNPTIANGEVISELADIVWKQSLDRIGEYVAGTELRQYLADQHAYYLDEAEARADAEKRIADAKIRAAKTAAAIGRARIR